MNICVLARSNSWYVSDLQRAAGESGDQIFVAGFSQLTGSVGKRSIESVGDHLVSDIDAILVRSMPPGSLEQVIFRMNALQQIADSTAVAVINDPRSMEIAIDKYLCLCKLRDAGLAVPETRVAQQAADAMEQFSELNQNVVIKPLFGGEGRGVMRVTDEEVAWRVFKTLERAGSVIYQQKWVEAGHRDTRILLIGDRHFAMQRHNPDDWRSNVSRGATTSRHEPNEQQLELARIAASACQCQIAGVDLLRDQEGEEWVIEVNAVPGWQALSRCLDVDVARHVLDYCREAVRGNS